MISIGRRYCDFSVKSDERTCLIFLSEMALDAQKIPGLDIVTQWIGDEGRRGRVRIKIGVVAEILVGAIAPRVLRAPELIQRRIAVLRVVIGNGFGRESGASKRARRYTDLRVNRQPRDLPSAIRARR